MKYSYVCDNEVSESLFDTQEEAEKAGFESNLCAKSISIIKLQKCPMINCIMSEHYADIQEGTIKTAIINSIMNAVQDDVCTFKDYEPDYQTLNDYILEWMAEQTVFELVDVPQIVFRPTKKNIFQRLSDFIDHRVLG